MWQGKEISPDRHGWIHVTRCLGHFQPRGMDSGRRPGDLLLLPLRRPDGAAQRPGPEHRIQSNAVSPGATRNQQYPYTRSQMERCNDAWKRSRSTWGRWYILTNGTRMRSYLSSCWSTKHQPTGSPAWRLPTWYLGGSFTCPVICYSGLQHLKVAIDEMKAHYNQLANSAGFDQGNRVWLYPYQKERRNTKISNPFSHQGIVVCWPWFWIHQRVVGTSIRLSPLIWAHSWLWLESRIHVRKHVCPWPLRGKRGSCFAGCLREQLYLWPLGCLKWCHKACHTEAQTCLQETCALWPPPMRQWVQWSEPLALGLCGTLCCCGPECPATTAAYTSPPCRSEAARSPYRSPFICSYRWTACSATG